MNERKKKKNNIYEGLSSILFLASFEDRSTNLVKLWRLELLIPPSVSVRQTILTSICAHVGYDGGPSCMSHWLIMTHGGSKWINLSSRSTGGTAKVFSKRTTRRKKTCSRMSRGNLTCFHPRSCIQLYKLFTGIMRLSVIRRLQTPQTTSTHLEIVL